MDLSNLHRFHIAPGWDPADPDTWIWENRSADVDADEIRADGGRADEIGQVDTGSLSLRVDNAGGHYCTTNPLGRWYGLLARNCPARWGVVSGAEAFGTAAASGWGTPDVGTSWTLEGTLSDWSISSGMGRRSFAAANAAFSARLDGADARNGDATFIASSPVVATGAALRIGLQVRYTDSSDHIFAWCEFGVAGAVTATVARQYGGSLTVLATASAGITYSAAERIAVRVNWDGPTIRLMIWEEASPPPTTWTAIGTDNLCQGSKVGLRFWRLSGNSNTSPVVLAVDDVEIEAVEAVGTIPAFPVRWDPTAQTSWAPLQIAGILRRLGQGAVALRSPMYRQISGYTRLVGYWPIEDGRDSSQLANVVTGGLPGTVTQMDLGVDGPAGSASAATFTQITDASRISGSFKAASTTAGWQISWSVKLAALPGAGLRQMIAWSTTAGYGWAVNLDSGIYNVRVVDPSDTLVVNSNVSFTGTGEPNQWVTFRMKATASGGTVSWEFAWFVQGQETPYGNSGSFSGAVGALRSWSANGNSSMQNGSMCQVFGVTTGTDNLQSYNALRAFDGYVGELAAARVARLCDEENIPVAVEAGDSEPMGLQPLAGLLDLLRQCEAADMGVLYEAGAAFGYRPRANRYNRPVTVALEIAADGDVSDPPPEPTDDDQRVRNEWTVSRLNGSEGTVAAPIHIALSGRYPDTATINILADERLVDHAGWRVHLGTWGEMRWPQITLNFTDRPDLLTAWLGRPFGARITISGVPAQGPVGSDIDLIIEGWSQEITTTSWTVTLNCSPARPWEVPVIDGATSLKDSRSSRLGSSLSSSGTTVTVYTDDPRETWSTTAAYDLRVGGEVIGVPAAGMGAPVGSNPYTQTITGAVRAKNGIVKSHLAGTQISLADPKYKAL